METISSAQNPKIKMLLSLQEKSKSRRDNGLFTVEGRRELTHCIEAGYKLKTIFVCEEMLSLSDRGILKEVSCDIIGVTPSVYSKIAYRGSTEGFIAEVYSKNHDLSSLTLSEKPLIIILEAVEKPGNLGAVLRTADAAGADAVIICDPLTDIYNPNIIRSSIGAVFTTQIAAASSEDTIKWLKDRGIRIHTAQLQDSSLYYQTDFTQPTAIIMGTESTGLTEIWRAAADTHIRIPMLGKLDSLNVSTSASILIFEAIRQRLIK